MPIQWCFPFPFSSSKKQKPNSFQTNETIFLFYVKKYLNSNSRKLFKQNNTSSDKADQPQLVLLLVDQPLLVIIKNKTHVVRSLWPF